MGIGADVGEFGGGLTGELAAQHNEEDIQKLLTEWKSRYQNLPPTMRVGVKNVGQSNLSGITEDPKYKAAEDEALRRLMESATSGGMTAADKMKLEQSKMAGLDYERGTRGAMESSLRRRGMGGSGAEISADLGAQQGGVDRAYQGDVATAGAASDRALAALAAAGGFASNLSANDLARKTRAGDANDRITMFNAGRGDRADYYNSAIPHQDALDQAHGLDAEANADIAQNNKWADHTRGAYRGYGKEAGGIIDELVAM